MMEIDYLRWIKNLEGYEFLKNCVANHHGFLSPILLDIWMSIVPSGNPDYYARLFSVLIFTILLIIILFLNDDEIDKRTKLLSGFFISINGLLVAFSRNSRLLTLFVLLTFLLAYYTYKNLKSFNLKNSILLFLFSVLAFINHPLTMIYAPAIVLSALIIAGVRRETFKRMFPLFIGGVIVLPYYIWLFKYGRAETELLPLNFNTIFRWITYLIDDDLIICIFLAILLVKRFGYDINTIKEIFKGSLIKFFLYVLILGLFILSGVSLFLPLTREYYIIPLTIFSSIIMGAYLSRLEIKIVFVIIGIIGIKAISSQMIFDRQIIEFHSSYGYEKTALNELRKSEKYKSLNLEDTVFINLPVYHSRAFDYYRTEGEDYFPKLNKFGYVEEVLNSEYLLKNIGHKNFYLILWDEIKKMKDPSQINLYKINMKILDELFTKEQIWEYDFYKKKKIRVYQLTPIQDLAS